MDELTEQMWQLVPYTRTLGIRAVRGTPEVVELALDFDPSLSTTGGTMHGGALMSLADSAGALAAFLNLPQGSKGTTTIESKTNFLAAAREGTVTATATVLHRGRTVIVVETELRRADGRLVAKTTQTQAVLS